MVCNKQHDILNVTLVLVTMLLLLISTHFAQAQNSIQFGLNGECIFPIDAPGSWRMTCTYTYTTVPVGTLVDCHLAGSTLNRNMLTEYNALQQGSTSTTSFILTIPDNTSITQGTSVICLPRINRDMHYPATPSAERIALSTNTPVLGQAPLHLPTFNPNADAPIIAAISSGGANFVLHVSGLSVLMNNFQIMIDYAPMNLGYTGSTTMTGDCNGRFFTNLSFLSNSLLLAFTTNSGHTAPWYECKTISLTFSAGTGITAAGNILTVAFPQLNTFPAGMSMPTSIDYYQDIMVLSSTVSQQPQMQISPTATPHPVSTLTTNLGNITMTLPALAPYSTAATNGGLSGFAYTRPTQQYPDFYIIDAPTATTQNSYFPGFTNVDPFTSVFNRLNIASSSVSGRTLTSVAVFSGLTRYRPTLTSPSYLYPSAKDTPVSRLSYRVVTSGVSTTGRDQVHDFHFSMSDALVGALPVPAYTAKSNAVYVSPYNPSKFPSSGATVRLESYGLWNCKNQVIVRVTNQQTTTTTPTVYFSQPTISHCFLNKLKPDGTCVMTQTTLITSAAISTGANTWDLPITFNCGTSDFIINDFNLTFHIPQVIWDVTSPSTTASSIQLDVIEPAILSTSTVQQQSVTINLYQNKQLISGLVTSTGFMGGYTTTSQPGFHPPPTDVVTQHVGDKANIALDITNLIYTSWFLNTPIDTPFPILYVDDVFAGLTNNRGLSWGAVIGTQNWILRGTYRCGTSGSTTSSYFAFQNGAEVTLHDNNRKLIQLDAGWEGKTADVGFLKDWQTCQSTLTVSLYLVGTVYYNRALDTTNPPVDATIWSVLTEMFQLQNNQNQPTKASTASLSVNLYAQEHPNTPVDAQLSKMFQYNITPPSLVSLSTSTMKLTFDIANGNRTVTQLLNKQPVLTQGASSIVTTLPAAPRGADIELFLDATTMQRINVNIDRWVVDIQNVANGTPADQKIIETAVLTPVQVVNNVGEPYMRLTFSLPFNFTKYDKSYSYLMFNIKAIATSGLVVGAFYSQQFSTQQPCPVLCGADGTCLIEQQICLCQPSFYGEKCDISCSNNEVNDEDVNGNTSVCEKCRGLTTWGPHCDVAPHVSNLVYWPQSTPRPAQFVPNQKFTLSTGLDNGNNGKIVFEFVYKGNPYSFITLTAHSSTTFAPFNSIVIASIPAVNNPAVDSGGVIQFVYNLSDLGYFAEIKDVYFTASILGTNVQTTSNIQISTTPRCKAANGITDLCQNGGTCDATTGKCRCNPNSIFQRGDFCEKSICSTLNCHVENTIPYQFNSTYNDICKIDTMTNPDKPQPICNCDNTKWGGTRCNSPLECSALFPSTTCPPAFGTPQLISNNNDGDQQQCGCNCNSPFLSSSPGSTRLCTRCTLQCSFGTQGKDCNRCMCHSDPKGVYSYFGQFCNCIGISLNGRINISALQFEVARAQRDYLNTILQNTNEDDDENDAFLTQLSNNNGNLLSLLDNNTSGSTTAFKLFMSSIFVALLNDYREVLVKYGLDTSTLYILDENTQKYIINPQSALNIATLRKFDVGTITIVPEEEEEEEALQTNKDDNTSTAYYIDYTVLIRPDDKCYDGKTPIDDHLWSETLSNLKAIDDYLKTSTNNNPINDNQPPTLVIYDPDCNGKTCKDGAANDNAATSLLFNFNSTPLNCLFLSSLMMLFIYLM